MKKHVILTIGILALFLLSSCSADDRSFETRRQFAIQSNKEHLASTKNEVRVKWEKEILSALASADAKSISSPKIASAILGNGKSGTYGLFVFWIENYPSVDSVELRLDSQSTPIIIHIPDVELKQMRVVAKDTIVFGSEYEWSELPEMSKTFEQITSPKGLEVRLLRAKAAATDWFPVDFYKSGKWISGIVTNK